MILFGDYHTHTKHSDGYNTIEENVVAAINKGLKQIALTEHGFSHMAFGLKRKRVKSYKAELDYVRKKHKNEIDVLFGIEANIISLNGEIDLTKQEQEMFDVIVVGYHKTYKPISIKNLFNFFLPNTFSLFRQGKKRIEKNTQAYIKAIKNNKIDILSHLNYGGCRVNCVEIAKVAKEHNVYIELNGKRILFTDKEILEMQKTGVKFIINSDAHYAERVGKNNKAFNIIERLNIPKEQLVNVENIPKFKNYNK